MPRKNLIIVLTVMMSAFSLALVFAEGAGTPEKIGGNLAGVASQSSQQSVAPSVELQQITGQPARPSGSVQSNQSPPGSSLPGWPNYSYPQYNNPYYNGGSPGDVLSGVIDWMLGFPSSAWDSFSEYLDNKLFPRSPATYGGHSDSQAPIPEASVKPKNLPPASSYNPKGANKTP